jgi:hypothetical protein
MKRGNYVYPAVVIIFITIYASVFYSQAGLRPTLIVCGSMVGGMVIWLKTTFRIHIETKKIIPIYLFTLTLFFLHMTEEFITDFPGGINSIFHTSWTLRDFGILIALVGPIVWVFGGIALYYKNPLGYYLAWFIFFGMLIGEPTHYLVFPMFQSGRYSYFSGMWTSLFPMVPAIYGVYLILTEYKKEKSKFDVTNASIK